MPTKPLQHFGPFILVDEGFSAERLAPSAAATEGRQNPLCRDEASIAINSNCSCLFCPARYIVFGFSQLFLLITVTGATALGGLGVFLEPMATKSRNPSPGVAVLIGACAVCSLI